MTRKYLIFLTIVGLVGLLIGCHAGGNSPFAPKNGETVVTPETRIVGANGRFDDIIFPSGAVIKCPNDKTFKEGVKVTANEEKVPVITDNSGKFSYIYNYNISAVLPAENTLSDDVPVNTVEKPLSVTLPNNLSDNGTCYIGTRASDKDPWHYSLATDGTTANARFVRLSAKPTKICSFDLYRLNVQFRLFVFENESSKDEPKVDSVTITPSDKVEIKDGKYTGKLAVKLNLDGDSLNSMKAENLVARIIYRSQNQQSANISFITNKTDSSDKAVSGFYEHSFEISDIKIDKSLGNTAELSFELALDGISLTDFPTEFLVELYSNGKDSNSKPFTYTSSFSFETKEEQNNPDPEPTPTPTPQPEPQPEPELYALAVNSGAGIASVEGAGNYKAGESVTVKCSIKDGYEFDSWSGDKTGSTNELTFNMPESNVSITANAKVITYNIAFNLDDGQTTEDNPVNYDVTSATITLKNPTKTGYTFVGWSGTGLTGNTNTTVSIAQGSTGDRTYTANYTPISYTLTYNLDDGQTTEDNPLNYDVTSATITLKNPTKTGYTFVGWSGTGLTGNTNTTVSIAQGSTGDRSYTANWSINSYNLTINKTTGINTVTGDGLHEYNSSITASCTMLAGYEFDKWTGDFTTETFAMPANNATMTANAKPIVYNITYSGIDGATFETANPTSYDITSATITLNNPTKANHLFVGWTEGTATFPVMLGQITNGSTEDKTFTAHFLEILTFNLSGGVSLVMHKCPAGSFMMGSPDDELGHQSNETYHKVTLTNDFYIGKFEVTQEQYYAVMESNPSNFTGDNSRPVEKVSYDDLTKANGFLAILNASFSSQLPDGYHFDLPTEAQWEYACRAGTGTSLNNGTNITKKTGICDNLGEVGWYDKNSGNTTKPVGQKLPNAWGLYDMHGNVYEWCRDGFADYTSQEENPIGVNTNDNYVNRGGSGENPASNCRSAFRNYQWKRVAVGFIGFRVALVKD